MSRQYPIQRSAWSKPSWNSGWRKLLFAPHRPSRFHTQYGQIMPLNAWLRLPLTIAERFTSIPSRRPWIVPSAIPYLDEIMQPNWRVLELGAGSSTAWLEVRSRELISFETDPSWYEKVSRQLKMTRLQACDPRRVERAVAALDTGSFDLAFVDNTGDRAGLLAEVALLCPTRRLRTPR
jgi:hypothetical protein